MSVRDDRAPKGKADAPGIARRGFLGAALGLGAGAAALGGGATPVVAQTGSERTRARYRETDHIRTYYATNRYFRGA